MNSCQISVKTYKCFGQINKKNLFHEIGQFREELPKAIKPVHQHLRNFETSSKVVSIFAAANSQEQGQFSIAQSQNTQC